MNLSRQCAKVYEYIRAHPGCTKLEIIIHTGVTYPSARIAALRKAGVPIIAIGKKKELDAGTLKQFAIREASLDTLPIPGLLSPGDPQRS